MPYPTHENKSHFDTRINPVTRLVNWAETLLRPKRRFADQLNLVSDLPTGLQRGIVCLGVMKNESLRIADFLSHYRKLGVSGFVLIDNGSSDGTLEYAIEQPDCGVLSTNHSYPASGFGSQWINAAIDRYGLRGRWQVVADLDELLVYDQCEKYKLPELARLLETAGLNALPCLMLDMYDDGDAEHGEYVAGGSMIDAAPMFDATGYRRDPSLIKSLRPATALAIAGGPRARTMFDHADKASMLPYLHKVPLMKWNSGAGMRTSHEVDPMIRNTSPLRGALLHFKFLNNSNLTDNARMQELDHWNGNQQHSRYFEALGQTAGTTFMFEGSDRYASSRTLVHHELISKLEWAS
ncbi:MAG: glycosyltransferase family 2 protein [Anderseniella sp.]